MLRKFDENEQEEGDDVEKIGSILTSFLSILIGISLRFCTNSAFANFQSLILSGDADAIEFHFGCIASARTLFL